MKALLSLQQGFADRRRLLGLSDGANVPCVRHRYQLCGAVPGAAQPVKFVALKEWAVTVAALGNGIQTVFKLRRVFCLGLGEGWGLIRGKHTLGLVADPLEEGWHSGT